MIFIISGDIAMCKSSLDTLYICIGLFLFSQELPTATHMNPEIPPNKSNFGNTL